MKSNPKVRETIVSVAKLYTNEDISYLEKNSNISNEKALKYITELHIGNPTISRVFKQQLTKKLKKLNLA